MGEILNLIISKDGWLRIYRLTKIEAPAYFAPLSCLILSIGFHNKTKDSDMLVAETFHDVYVLALNSKIDPHLWNIIPKDEAENEEEDFLPFVNLWSFFDFTKIKKRHEVPKWDYCELLIRTISIKFITFNWPKQSFLMALKGKEDFERAIEYCGSFKKGIKFLQSLTFFMDSSKSQISSFQKQVLRRYLE